MERTRVWLVVAALSLVGGTETVKAAQDNVEQAEKAAISDAIRRHLIDPESARFGPITVHRSYACATVNSKNRFGGYAGNQQALLIKQDQYGWFLIQFEKELSHMRCAEMLVRIAEKDGKTD